MFSLNQEQQRVLDAVRDNKNVFVTGSAGVGKSFVIKELCKDLDSRNKNFRLMAPTGVAAINIGGVTIHRFAKIQPQIKSLADYVKSKFRSGRAMWANIDVIIIDEVSMIHPDMFKLLDDIARLHRGNNKPFGGIQMVLFGDLFQLPYVPNKEDKGRKYIFETKSWTDLDLDVVLLHRVMRQDDATFITALNDLRVGNFSETFNNMIATCSRNKKDPTKHYVKLRALNSQKNMENEARLAELNTESKTYEAKDIGDDKCLVGCRAEKKLTLKIGCPVMLLWNKPEFDLSNGSIGVVTGFQPQTDSPIVRFNSGPELVIERQEWKVLERHAYGFKTIAQRTQYPLAIAYSISIHKSQSLSLDHVEVDLKGTFTVGQMYVALSRARTLEGLVVRNYDKCHVMVDDNVVEFYQGLTN